MIHFNLPGMRKEIEALEEETQAPDFWGNSDNSSKILQKIKGLKDKEDAFNSLNEAADEIDLLIEIGNEEEDLSYLKEAKEIFTKLKEDTNTMNLETLLSGPYDKNNAIISLHAGAGGTEAQDWVEMLYRMYSRWCERRGFKTETIDFLDGDEAGIKSVTMLVSGINAYGYLKAEKGVHRLVRISPFDASGRRHTSFASLDVLPELDDDIEVDINPDEIRVDTFRASGAGGQHINKTDSAIRITHFPTGIVVSCQNERSQHKNRDTAMKMLKAKLLELKEQEQKDKLSDIQGEQMDIGFGSQIRSYVFHPYNLVKDHRTNFEMGNINAVMDGELDGFINEYLKLQVAKRG